MKQVLFIGMSHNKGGIETFMMNVFLKLEGHGFHFTFTNTSDKNKSLAYNSTILKNGGSIINIPINSSFLGHLYRFNKAKSLFERYNDFDIVHLNAMTINVIFWIKAAKYYGINKLIIHSHNSNIIYNSKIKKYLASFLAHRNIRYLNNTSDITELAVSRNSGEWMFHNTNFKVVPNGIDTKKYLFNSAKRHYFRKKLGINNNAKVIVTVAKLSYQKNYRKIINIFFNIHKMDSTITLVIMGDGPEMDHVKNKVKKLYLQNHVYFLGSINNVNDMLNIADLMLMPSRYEGFPFALLEAQTNGVPALVSKEVIPKECNITGKLTYYSLKKSNLQWAKLAIQLLKIRYNRVFMNKLVKESKYNMINSILNIRKIYLS